jgi:hypothetical protein
MTYFKLTKSKFFKAGIALAVTLLGITNVKAQEDWEYSLSPMYLWATGIEGESQIGPITAPVSIEFEDAVSNLEGIFTIHFEAKKGDHGILANWMHIKLDPESTLPTGASVGVDLTNNVLDVAGFYSFAQSGTLDFLYGLRYTDFSLDATIGPMVPVTVVDDSWIDMFLGLRKHVTVSDRSGFVFRGDIGTGESDFTWSASAIYSHQFSDRISGLAGYKWLDYDYETGVGPTRFTYDVTYQGPLLALLINW